MKLHNEKGITLVIVLLMITVFSILGLSIIGYALSNTKQVEKSEKDMQAVDLAEMGVVHYKNLFITEAANELKLIKERVDEQIISKKLITEEAIMAEFYTELQSPITRFIPVLTYPYPKYITSDSNHSYRYEIKDPVATFNEETKEISLKFTSTGIVEPKGKEDISITIKLNVNTLVDFEEDSGDSGDTGSSGEELDLTIPTKPSKLTNICSENGNIANECYYVGTFDVPSLDGNTIYVDGQLTSNGNISINNSNIYATGGGTFSNINGGILHSTIYIGGTSDFKNLQFNGGGIQDSKIYIWGNAYFDNIKDGILRTTIYITGDVTFVKENVGPFSSDSTVCVGGKVYNHSDVRIFTPDQEGFETSCPLFVKKESGPTIPSNLESDIFTQLDNLDIQYDYRME